MRRRLPVAVVAATMLLVAVALTLGSLARSQDRELAGSIIQAVAAVITLTAACAAALWRFGRHRGAPDGADVERHLDRLAGAVTRQWEQAVMERRLRYPAPLPLRWVWSSSRVSGPAGEAVGSAAGARMPPLPGVARTTAGDLAGGGIEDLFRVYAGLDSGRIVVLGRAGGGKSSVGMLVLLQALHHREQLDPGDRARVPVPVLLTFYGWDPRRQPFASWLVDRLTGDYPNLAEAGRHTVATLVRDGRVAVFLDGLDEIPETSRAAVLRSLDRQVTCRIMLLTRGREMVEAVQEAHLAGAAAVEILPIPAVQAADYLARVGVNPVRPACRDVVARLTQAPDGPLARAVAQPLMLALLRDSLAADDDIRELVALDLRGDTAGIENYLLERIVPLAYQPAGATPGRVAPDAADRLLRFVAANLTREAVRDFAWWDIPRWLPGGPRVLVTAVLVGFLWGSVNGLCVLSSGWLLGSEFATPADALANAFMVGPSTGMIAGLVVAQPGRGAAARRRAAFSRTVITGGLVSGLIVAIAMGVRYALLDALLSFGGSIVAAVLLARPPRLRRPGGRPRLVLGHPGTLSVAAAACGTFLGVMIENARFGVMGAVVGGILTALVNGTLIFFVQPSGVLSAPTGGGSPPRRLLAPVTMLAGLPGACAFGLMTTLMMVDTRTGTPSLQAVAGVASGVGFYLATWPVLGLIVRRGVPDDGSISSPLRLVRAELRTRLAVGSALGVALCLPAVPQVLLLPAPPGDVGDVRVVNLLLVAQTVLLFAVVGGPLFALVSSRTWQTVLAGLQLRASGRGPGNVLRCLRDAHDRRVLRAVGPAYQFRHARLQERLGGPGTDLPAPAAGPPPRRPVTRHRTPSPRVAVGEGGVLTGPDHG